MNQPTQLTRLIWNFYRENKQELQQLKYLAKCKVFRWWGVLHIRCDERETAEAIVAVDALLAEPLTQLRLANTVKIWVNNTLFAIVPVNSDKLLA